MYSTNKHERAFKLLNKNEIMKKQETSIYEVSDDIGISPTLSRALLMKYGWNKEKVMDAISSEEDLISRVFKFDLTTAERNK